MTRAPATGPRRGRRAPSTPERRSVVHRAIRVTAAASAGFYPFVYGVDRPNVALYALFAAVALGMLSPIPGSGRQRATVMLRALPVGLALVTLGTVLAVTTWAAVLGMLVVGFVLTFAAVAGPRPAGAAPGLQLFYILACFPPYAPQALGARLAGLTLGVLLLAACEVFLLPEPPSVSYRERLADAVATAGQAADAAAGGRAAEGQAAPAERLRESGRQLRLSYLPPAERPAGAGRVDRALAEAGAAARALLVQLARLTEAAPARAPGGDAGATTGTDPGTGTDPDATTDTGTGTDPASAELLNLVATTCSVTESALRTGRPRSQSDPLAMEGAIRDFQAARNARGTGEANDTPHVPVLRRQSAVLAVAESSRILETSVQVALDGGRTRPIEPRELFWYADASTALLWWRRLAGNMTLHSVQFQNAVRTALGLGAARLVAGSLDLSHGFWVLLAVLTLGRTTAWETWKAVRPALVGTLAGAVAAGTVLLVVGQHTEVYAAVLGPGMLAAFALGPLLGIAWGQALFTLVVSTAFAQIAPVTWHLAGERILDVATGSAIGLLCGLLAWRAGATSEVRRTMADLLRSTGPLITGTVQVLTATPPGSASPPPTYPVLHRLRLAEAAYLQNRSEPGGTSAAPMDWHAVLITANHVMLGAHWLPLIDLPTTGVGEDITGPVRTAADRLALETRRIAALCVDEQPPAGPPAAGADRPAGPAPGSLPLPLPLPTLIDLEHWLSSLRAELAHIESSVPDGSETAGR